MLAGRLRRKGTNMKLSTDEIIIINNAKIRLKYWNIIRILILGIAIVTVMFALYLIFIRKIYYYGISISCFSGVIFHVVINTWNGLKKDHLLSKIDVS